MLLRGRACSRRPFLPYSTFLFFPLVGYGLYGYGSHYAPAIDAQRTVIFNNQTMANVRCALFLSVAALAWSGGGFQYWLGLTWPGLLALLLTSPAHPLPLPASYC